MHAQSRSPALPSPTSPGRSPRPRRPLPALPTYQDSSILDPEWSPNLPDTLVQDDPKRPFQLLEAPPLRFVSPIVGSISFHLPQSQTPNLTHDPLHSMSRFPTRIPPVCCALSTMSNACPLKMASLRPSGLTCQYPPTASKRPMGSFRRICSQYTTKTPHRM